MVKRILAVAFVWVTAFTLTGCSTSHPTSETADVFSRWRRSRDYYALLEIVDTRIDPRWSQHVFKADVVRYIGEGMDDPDSYPHAGPNYWVYVSSRPIPTGSYLFIEFDKDGFVKTVSWGSE